MRRGSGASRGDARCVGPYRAPAHGSLLAGFLQALWRCRGRGTNLAGGDAAWALRTATKPRTPATSTVARTCHSTASMTWSPLVEIAASAVVEAVALGLFATLVAVDERTRPVFRQEA